MSKHAIKHLAARVGRAFPRPRVDPVQRAMDRAPIDDEPLTEEEERSLDEIEAGNGPYYSLEDVRAALARRRNA